MIDLKQLKRLLVEKSQYLTSIEEKIRLVEQDFLLIQKEKFKIIYCVDYYDLHLYLTQEMVNQNKEFDYKKYINYVSRKLFFNEMHGCIMLLPWYYEELKDNYKKQFFRISDLKKLTII